MINSAALPSRSLFAWKLSKVQRICLVLLLVFTDTWHNICPPVSCLWKCPQIYTCPSPLATLFLSRANRLPPLRDAGNSVVKSPLMRLDIYETLFPFMAVRTLELSCRLDDFWIQLSFFNSPCSYWLLIGVGRCLWSPIKKGENSTGRRAD